jgi:hypothetical protein
MRKWFEPRAVLTEIVIWSAFAASAGHIYKVATVMGNPWPVAAVHALGLDGLVYVGIVAYQDGARIRGALAVVYGGGVSLAFNAASYTTGHHLPVWIMAMSMPISLVLGVLVGHGAVVRKKTPPAPVLPVEPESQARPTLTVVPDPVVPAAPRPAPRRSTTRRKPVAGKARRPGKAELYAEAVRMHFDEGLTGTEIAERLGAGKRSVQGWIAEEERRRGLDKELLLLSSSASKTPL